MLVQVYDNATQVARAAAILLAAQVIEKPDSVLGLATGSTPIRTYQEVIGFYQSGILDFSRVTTFNLDEYCHLSAEHECSYHYFMWNVFFKHINIPCPQTHLPDGNACDLHAECKAYDARIAGAGGVDMQLLGIGRNGHIGFNEPADTFLYNTHVTELTPTLLNELVERIEVHAPDKSSGKRKQKIDVRFNFVGVIGKLDFLKSNRSAA